MSAGLGAASSPLRLVGGPWPPPRLPVGGPSSGSCVGALINNKRANSKANIFALSNATRLFELIMIAINID